VAAFELILAATPTAAERAESEQTLAQWAKLFGPERLAEPRRRARVDLIEALLNHNDFITIR
jgi:hypothetical protein